MDLLVDVMISAACLKTYSKPSLIPESYLSRASWYMSPQYTKAEINRQQVIIVTYHLPVSYVK